MFYKPTVKGVSDALCLDRESIFRYQTGQTEVPDVVYEDMRRLLDDKPPDPTFWDAVTLLRIDPRTRIMEDTDKRENVYQITFCTFSFYTRRFPVRVNRRFREALLKDGGMYTPPVGKEEWVRVADQALNGGFYGQDASDPEGMVRYCTFELDKD